MDSEERNKIEEANRLLGSIVPAAQPDNNSKAQSERLTKEAIETAALKKRLTEDLRSRSALIAEQQRARDDNVAGMFDADGVNVARVQRQLETLAQTKFNNALILVAANDNNPYRWKSISRKHQEVIAALINDDDRRYVKEELAKCQEDLSTVRNERKAPEAEARQANQHMARLFASQSGCSEAVLEDDSWLDFVQAMGQRARAPSSRPRSLPWGLRGVWSTEAEASADEPPAQSQAMSLVDACSRLHGRRLDVRVNDETVRLLGIIRQHVWEAEGPTAVCLVSQVLKGFLSEVWSGRDACPSNHFCVLGVWWVASAVQGRWPDMADVASLRADLQVRLADTPMEALRLVLCDEGLKESLMASPPFRVTDRSMMYFADEAIGLYREVSMPDWVFLLDLKRDSVRMVHRSLGDFPDPDQVSYGPKVSLAYGDNVDDPGFSFIMHCVG